MLRETHIIEIRTAAKQLRAKWTDLTWTHNEESRGCMASRLEGVADQLVPWKPATEPTPIEKVGRGWWFTRGGGDEIHYVRVGRCERTARYRVYGPDDSKHGTDTEDLRQGVTFYPAPAPSQLMAMCSEQKGESS